jgi:PPOX class probable F420-dependent enzyme
VLDALPSIGGVDADTMRERVDAARVGRLATVGADGQPHLVPICFALVGDVIYSAVDQKPKRSTELRRLANIRATGRGCLLVDESDEDWSALWWVRLDALGREVADPDETTRAVDALRAKYEQYGGQPPSGPVLALEVTRWSAWSARD